MARQRKTLMGQLVGALFARTIDAGDVEPTSAPAPTTTSPAAQPNRPELRDVLGRVWTSADEALAALPAGAGTVLRVDSIELPPGFGVRLAQVQLDARETYEAPWGWAFNARGLNRLLAAAGGSEMGAQRADDGRVPHLVAMRVGVRWPNLPPPFGREYWGARTVDLRGDPDDKKAPLGEDAAFIIDLADAQGVDPTAAWDEVLKLRRTADAMAQTFARSQAIMQALGIERSYSADQIRRPFIVGRVAWSGRFGDADADREARLTLARAAAANIGHFNSLLGGPRSEVRP
ncbi:MAG: hypothetical protein KC620_09810 [Myxococcales bacterium]|nr:hypothetical protein [Myxococcales bacterium]